jgi:hypothetical protein
MVWEQGGHVVSWNLLGGAEETTENLGTANVMKEI